MLDGAFKAICKNKAVVFVADVPVVALVQVVENVKVQGILPETIFSINPTPQTHYIALSPQRR